MGLVMKLILGLSVFCTIIILLVGEVFQVGDSDGWTSVSHVDYKHWAYTKTFHVGDTIVFRYTEDFHNVIQVNYNDYKACNATEPYATFATGNDSIIIRYPGHFFFICSYPAHCQAGQKVDIRVPSPNNSALRPAPSPSLVPDTYLPTPPLVITPKLPPVPRKSDSSALITNLPCLLMVFWAVFA